MSHNFKRPASPARKLTEYNVTLDPATARRALDEPDEQEREINMLAMATPNQAALEVMLEGATPQLREAMIERLRPFLPFEVVEVTRDCPVCGMYRGSAIPHECLGPN